MSWGICGFFCGIWTWGGGWWFDACENQTQAKETGAAEASQIVLRTRDRALCVQLRTAVLTYE